MIERRGIAIRHPTLPALSGLGLLLLLTLVGACAGDGPPPSGEGAPVEETVAAEAEVPNPLGLPPEYRGPLRSEMVQVEAGMQRLLGHLVRAEGDDAAAVAREIHDSFILKQELSESQLRELRSLLPGGFVELDRTFHQTAAFLAGAAERNDLREAVRLYGEMSRSCVDCHARYTSERFPVPEPTGETEKP